MVLRTKEKRQEMAPRGGYREGSGRPLKDGSERRQTLNCRVAAKTLEWLAKERERTQQSTGELVDRAIEVARSMSQKAASKGAGKAEKPSRKKGKPKG